MRGIDDLPKLVVETFKLIQNIGDGRSNAIDNASAVDVDRIPTEILVAAGAHQVPSVTVATPVVRASTIPATSMLTRKTSSLTRHVGSRIDSVYLLAGIISILFGEQFD